MLFYGQSPQPTQQPGGGGAPEYVSRRDVQRPATRSLRLLPSPAAALPFATSRYAPTALQPTSGPYDRPAVTYLRNRARPRKRRKDFSFECGRIRSGSAAPGFPVGDMATVWVVRCCRAFVAGSSG